MALPGRDVVGKPWMVSNGPSEVSIRPWEVAGAAGAAIRASFSEESTLKVESSLTFEESSILRLYRKEKRTTQSFIWRCLRLKRRIARDRPDIKVIFKFHHENAPSLTAFVVANYPTQNKTPVVP
ncbi:hypothetical protein J6590_053458 [Homalodisca vitripennis]|nr:hypothetical protein J6590_053458 [Homalodisca vitripennis]